ncbi:hypothetical protein FQN52_009453 [Onygenales sp. PD_12]|nr:hypothetical protein FQN52_009453 [Onygenales sp. PD_12]
MRNIFNYSNREYKKRVRADFPYFGALFAPTAATLEYQTICDYFHWIFDFDDMFDDGRLSKDPEGARRELDKLVAILSSETAVTKADGLRYVFQSIWKRIVQSSTKGAQERFAKYTRDYCDAIARQVAEGQQQLNNSSIEDYIKIRSESLGARPFFPLIEYSQFLDLPDEIFEHPAIKEIEAVAVEILVLHNDLLSYQKEYSTSPTPPTPPTSPNIITLYRHPNPNPNPHQTLPPLTQQQAYNSIDDLLRARYKRWYIAHANLPVLGEKVDEQVQRYVGGCADVVRSNLYWSFWTERYFGKEKEEVRRTRRVWALD